jgi:hypothetical protein
MNREIFTSLILMSLATATAQAESKGWVVLIPGSGSSGDQICIQNIPNLFGSRYFGKFQEILSDQGLDNFVCPQTHDDDTRTLEERAEECTQQIVAAQASRGIDCKTAPERDVVLLGHSMGGLIARIIAQDPRVSGCIKSELSLSTPHRGTPYADFEIDHAEKDEGWNFDIFGVFAKFAGYVPEHTRYLPELRADRSRNSPETFSAQDMPDNPAVRYFSLSASFVHDYSSPLEIMHAIVSSEMTNQGLDKTEFGLKNDGIVPEFSMLHGTYLGHLEINHWEMACSDGVRFSSGCSVMLGTVLPFLKSQLGQM